METIVLKNWKFILSERTKGTKRIRKGFKKILSGKSNFLDVASLGSAFLIGNRENSDYGRRSTDILEIRLAENGLLSFRSINNIYLLNPEDGYLV